MKRRILLLVGAMFVAACGGIADLDDLADGEEVFGTPPPTNEDGGFDVGGGEAGPVTVTAEPSQAWVEADGERFVYEAIGAVHYSCDISDEQITMNFQTNGPSFLIQGGKLDGEWILNLTFTVDENDIQYGATLPGDGSLGLEDGQLSYEGPIDRIENRDVMNPTVVDAKLAVNCLQPEGQPTAVIDGTEYVVSMVGADSVRCEVSDEAVIVEVNRLTSDDMNIDIGVESQEDGWFGHVSVSTPDGRFGAKDAPNPVGLTVDGSTVSYEGTFEGDSGDVEGSLVVTCPSTLDS
jgi:hypothetical protein